MNEFMRIERKNLTAASEVLPMPSLAEIPEVRAEKVARGKALVADPNYPSREQIKQMADLLAANLARGSHRHVRQIRPERKTVMRDVEFAPLI
jgi:Flp pilus assembly CpaE family ATPase